MAKTRTRAPAGKKAAPVAEPQARVQPAPAAVQQRVRVAMIGAGSMANAVHYPSLASLPDVEIAAICDLNEERLNETADRYGVKRRYTSYPRMIADVDPDAVYAIGQPHLMFDVWMWCLGQGLDLFIEKPLGLSLHQARALAHTAAEQGCITQVGFQRRSCPMVVRLRDECLRRGPVSHAVCRFYKWAPTPFLGARDHMMDDGVHAIDTLRWLCAGEVVEVQSRTRRIGTPDINFISAMLHFDNGAVGVLLNNWTSGKRIFSVEIHAPGIFVEAEHEGKGYLYADGDVEGVVYDSREVAGSTGNYVYGGFQAKSREFIDAVRTRVPPSSHFGDALKTMEVAEIILAQNLLRGPGSR
ncbi:MAG: Gfo/Idh/MocA family oxidoreductase [Candidatus Latescibacterota bacterium]